jgi:hypothetical protein
MPKCKKSNCREPALPTGKRYCAAHKIEYERKQREYQQLQLTLPGCPTCGERLSKTRADNGETICGDCDRRQAEENRKYAARAAFAEINTVEGLKSWLVRQFPEKFE